MLRLEFEKPLKTLEIKYTLLSVCRGVASMFGLDATFIQRPQTVYSGRSGEPMHRRTRIGNFKERDWRVDFNVNDRSFKKAITIGTITVLSPYSPTDMQFGGFRNAEFGAEDPAYDHITIRNPSEMGWRLEHDLNPGIIQKLGEGLIVEFVGCELVQETPATDLLFTNPKH
jgi:hypothetical protein